VHPVLLLICLAFAAFRSHEALLAENLMLRHQLTVLQRSAGRPKLRPTDRLLWAIGLRRLPNWKKCLMIVQPETVIRWHRMGFKLFWHWRSSKRSGGRPPVPDNVRDLIIRMAKRNGAKTKWCLAPHCRLRETTSELDLQSGAWHHFTISRRNRQRV